MFASPNNTIVNMQPEHLSPDCYIFIPTDDLQGKGGRGIRRKRGDDLRPIIVNIKAQWSQSVQMMVQLTHIACSEWAKLTLSVPPWALSVFANEQFSSVFLGLIKQTISTAAHSFTM